MALVSLMKMNSKRILTTIVAAMVVANVATPLASFAQVATTTPPASQLCARLSDLEAKIDQQIETRKAKIEASRTDAENRIKSRWEERDAKLAANRKQHDFNRSQHYEKLEARATTDAQKTAVEQFRTEMEAAVALRREAVNVAGLTFRQGLSNALTSRTAKVDTAMGAYANSVTTAIDKAQADCASGIAPKTVRSTLQADLKAAREKFVADKRAIEALISQMEPLVTARKAALQKAADDFKAAAEAATAKLRAVFETQ